MTSDFFPRERPDGTRGFGYTPAERQSWLGELRTASGYNGVGLLLNIGHARNNVPYSSEFNLSQWYATVGGDIIGYHLRSSVPF